MKKFLSLVLALVMTMSLVTVSAGAKDFTDGSKIQYNEAVDVMSAVKVIDGYTDGSFNPSTTLTRGAAAKIICNLILGPTTAGALVADAAPYKDVPVNHTFAGYIAYCQKAGIISGYADGTFKPANSLTGYAFMKMLLGALGYDASREGYTGANWSINVAKQALNIGLADGLNGDFNGVKAVTREEACLYAFNMIQADIVEYEKNSTITVGNVTVTDNSAAKSKRWGSSAINDGNIDGKGGDGYVQFAEEYFSDLKCNTSVTDAFERPATTWKVKAEEVGTYSKTPDLTYTEDVKVGTIYSDLGLSKSIAGSDITVYVDGVLSTGAGTEGDKVSTGIVKGEVSKKLGGNGILTEVFYDDDANTAIITEVKTYIGEIAAAYKATSARDAYVTLKGTDNTGLGSTYETDDTFAVDSKVLYTYSGKDGEHCVESMEAAKSVTGTLTAYTLQKDVTVGGTKYDANKASEAEILNMSQTVDKGTDVTAYLDANGYALYIDADTNDEYAVILDYAAPYGLNNARVKLLFTDGTTKKVDLDKVVDTSDSTVTIDSSNFFASTWNAGTTGQLTKYDIVSYTVNSDGEYKLTLLADATATVSGAAATPTSDGGTQVLKNGSIQVKVFAAASQADGETIFLSMNEKSGSDTTYSTYTGISNVPSATVKAGQTSVATVCKKTGDTADTVVFLLNNDDVKMSSSNKDIIFVKGNNDGTSYTKDLGTFYEYTAFINGEKTTLKVDVAHQMTEKTLVYGPEYNDKGILNGYEMAVDKNTAGGVDDDLHYVTGSAGVLATKAPVNGVITLAGTPYAYAKDCKTYLMDVDGNLSQIDVTSIGDDDNDHVWFKVDDDDIITDLYVETVDEAEVITPPADTDYKANATFDPTDSSKIIAKVKVGTSNAVARATAIAFLKSEGYTDIKASGMNLTATKDLVQETYTVTVEKAYKMTFVINSAYKINVSEVFMAKGDSVKVTVTGGDWSSVTMTAAGTIAGDTFTVSGQTGSSPCTATITATTVTAANTVTVSYT